MKKDRKSWNKELINHLFVPSEAEAIMSMPISLLNRQDQLIWNHTPNGTFSVSSAYRWLSKQKRQVRPEPEGCNNKVLENSMLKGLWKLKVKGKIKLFLWRALHQLLPTNSQLVQKRLNVDAICKTCREEIETWSTFSSIARNCNSSGSFRQ